MIDAKQAKAKSDEITKKNELSTIEKLIEKAISNGECSVDIEYISDVSREELKTLGYKVNYCDANSRYGSYFNISWN